MFSSLYQLFIYCEEFSQKWGNGLENILQCSFCLYLSFSRIFSPDVPINSFHMPSLAWVIWSKILAPWSCQHYCHHARYLAHPVLMEIYPEVLISWVPRGISVFASKSWGKITWGLWKLLPHSANEKSKHRKLKNNIYVQHCLGYHCIYPNMKNEMA